MDEEGDEEEGKVTASNNTTVRIYNSTTVCVCTWHRYVRIDIKTMSLMCGNPQYYSAIITYSNHSITFIT